MSTGQCMFTSLYVQVERDCHFAGYTRVSGSSRPGRKSPLSSRMLALVTAAALAVVPGAAPAGAAHRAAPRSTIVLPNGFQPEGIAIGKAPYAYFGSRA